MVVPSAVRTSGSQVSLPPGDYHPKLKSKVSISSIANAIYKRKSTQQNYPTRPQNYTKGYGPFTLSLNADHEAGSGLPMFSNGAVMSGSLEISKVSKLLQSIQIMVTIPARFVEVIATNCSYRLQEGSSSRTLEAPGLVKLSCFPTCSMSGAANTTLPCRRPWFPSPIHFRPSTSIIRPESSIKYHPLTKLA